MKTRRQKRERKLRKWNDANWAELPDFLVPNTGHLRFVGVSQYESDCKEREIAADVAKMTSDPDSRNELVSKWLDKAEKDSDFGVKFDRHLGMLTEAEATEQHEYHKRLFIVAGFVVTVVLAVLAILQFSR